jgi:hypothetical protein
VEFPSIAKIEIEDPLKPLGMRVRAFEVWAIEGF